MTKKLLLTYTFLFPITLFAQSCDRVFTKLPILPSLKISNEAYADSLTKTLILKAYSLNDDVIIYMLVVNDKSKIDYLHAISGKLINENKLKEAILQLADLWKAGMINGREVCAQILFKVKIADNKISILI